MKLKINSKSLLNLLAKCLPAVSTAPVLPILETVKIEAEKGELAISATDLNIGVIAKTDGVEVEKKGGVCISARLITDTLKALPDQPITLQVNGSNLVTITTANGLFKTPGEATGDFPTMPECEAEPALVFNADDFQQLCNRTLFAVSNDELRPAMTGVYLTCKDYNVVAVSTDAHKLSKVDFRQPAIKEFPSSIVPKPFLQAVKSLGNFSGDGSLYLTDSYAFTEVGSVTVFGRLIDARYPDWESVIPNDNPNVLTIDRNKFLSSLKRTVIFSNKTTKKVLLDCGNGQLKLHTVDTDFSNEATEEMTAEYKGEPMQISFNASYLTECLSAFTSESIAIEMSTPTRPGIVREPNGNGTFTLIMPLM